jgi:uncharacterized membrane protein YczE
VADGADVANGADVGTCGATRDGGTERVPSDVCAQDAEEFMGRVWNGGVAGMTHAVRSGVVSARRITYAERVLRCVIGLGLFGAGIALIFAAELGVAPWDILHEGIAELLGISVGWVIVMTGVVILLLWIPLRQRPGLGTALNAVEIGLVVDLVLPHLPTPEALVPRLALLAGGLVAIGLGSGIYIGSGIGNGPRDGLMMGLAARGISVRVARTLIEVTVLVIGVLLGGSFGLGTVAFTFLIGPLVQIFLPLFDIRGDVEHALAPAH